MQKAILAVAFMVAIGLSTHVSAQQYKTAVGIRLSSASAIVNNSVSVKHFLTEKTAIEALISFGNPFAIGGLAEFHQPINAPGLTWFYGGGAYLGFLKSYNPNTKRNETDPNFGAMGVVGLDYKFEKVPINLSLDWKPELNLVNDINFEPAALGLTARFTF